MTRVNIIKRRLRCPECENIIDRAYPEYRNILNYLNQYFGKRPDFYNKRRHGRSIKWYFANIPEFVMTELDRQNIYNFRHRMARRLELEFPELRSRIKVSLTEAYNGHYNEYRAYYGLIVSFKYHGRFKKIGEEDECLR